MSLELWCAYTVASTIVLVVPGPTILTVMSYSLARGREATVPLVAAVALGDMTALLFSLLGLGTLLAISSFWFTLVKVLGGCYLIYLGIRLLWAGTKLGKISGVTVEQGWRRLFINTYLVTALNPKGIVFFVAFLPQFVDHTEPVTTQLVLLAVTFVLLATLNASIYAIFAAQARALLLAPKASRAFQLSSGGLLCCAGIWALLAKRS